MISWIVILLIGHPQRSSDIQKTFSLKTVYDCFLKDLKNCYYYFIINPKKEATAFHSNFFLLQPMLSGAACFFLEFCITKSSIQFFIPNIPHF